MVLIALTNSSIKNTINTAAATSPLSALRVHGLRPLLFAVACYMVAFYGLYAFLGTHLTTILGFSTTIAGLATLIYGIGFGVIAPVDRLIDKYGVTRAAPMIFGMLLCIYALLGLFTASAIAILLLCFLWGAANHLGLNILVGQLTALSPDQRAAVLGLYSAVTYIAMFVGTGIFKEVFEAYGFTTAAGLSATCIAPTFLIAINKAQSGVKA